jgi:glyoxylase-like metal-dependent hydrolase (beta-lactamase superfamily II)
MNEHLDPIRNVRVISTGTVDIHPQHAYGSRAPTYWWILTSRRWLTRRPINVFVIEHRNGLVLFDTGQDRASVTDPDYFPSGPLGWFYNRLARFDIEPRDTLPDQLERIGYAAGNVDVAVLSHLHQDHIGGLPHLHGARIVVADSEHAMLDSRLDEARGVLSRHINLPGLNWDPIQPGPLDDADIAPFTHGIDLMGDHSMVLLPTPGHTPGSLSMLVRRPGHDPLLMVGDLTYDADAMEHDHVIPGVGSHRQLQDSTRRVLELKRRHPGLRILGAHDPAAHATLTQPQRQRTTTAA